MQQANQLRTLTTLLMFVGIVLLNTTLVLTGALSRGVTILIYVVAGLILLGTLRFQPRLSALATALLLAVPFVLALGGVLMGA